jgi:hypothetical protein
MSGNMYEDPFDDPHWRDAKKTSSRGKRADRFIGCPVSWFQWVVPLVKSKEQYRCFVAVSSEPHLRQPNGDCADQRTPASRNWPMGKIQTVTGTSASGSAYDRTKERASDQGHAYALAGRA